MPRCTLAMLAIVSTLACSGSDGATGPSSDPDRFTYPEPWPEDVTSLLTTTFIDGVGDQVAMPPEMDGPPYSGPVSYPPVDVERISLGVRGDFLFMLVRFATNVPTDRVHIPAAGEVEEQWVHTQGMNVALNSDRDEGTGGGGEGVSGIDIFFAIAFEYGSRFQVYANYGFPSGDLHEALGQVEGELGQGGPGHDFALVRYKISDLDAYLPRGIPMDVGSWSEAESYDAQGNLKYHHFAFDRVIDGGRWTIPIGA